MQSGFSKGIESINFTNLLTNASVLYCRCFRHIINIYNSNASNSREPVLRESKFRKISIIVHCTDILGAIFLYFFTIIYFQIQMLCSIHGS